MAKKKIKREHTANFDRLVNMPLEELRKETLHLKRSTFTRYGLLKKVYEYTPALHSLENMKKSGQIKTITKDMTRAELITQHNIYSRYNEYATSTREGARAFKDVFEDQYRELMSLDEDTKKAFFDAYGRFIEQHKDGSSFKYELWKLQYEYQIKEGNTEEDLHKYLKEELKKLQDPNRFLSQEEVEANLPDGWKNGTKL